MSAAPAAAAHRLDDLLDAYFSSSPGPQLAGDVGFGLLELVLAASTWRMRAKPLRSHGKCFWSTISRCSSVHQPAQPPPRPSALVALRSRSDGWPLSRVAAATSDRCSGRREGRSGECESPEVAGGPCLRDRATMPQSLPDTWRPVSSTPSDPRARSGGSRRPARVRVPRPTRHGRPPSGRDRARSGAA